MGPICEAAGTRGKPRISRLAALRKARRLTRQALAEQVGLHVMQIHRYEGGTSQPTLDVIRRLAVTLGVTADELVFGSEGGGPDQDLKLQFEAVSRFSREDKKAAQTLLDALISNTRPDAGPAPAREGG